MMRNHVCTKPKDYKRHDNDAEDSPHLLGQWAIVAPHGCLCCGTATILSCLEQGVLAPSRIPQRDFTDASDTDRMTMTIQ
jgi:hypothetical protein